MLETLIGPGLEHLDTPFEEEMAFGHDLIASLLQDEWKQQALETRSYRTGAYYRNIHRGANAFSLGDERIREIIGDIGYDDIIETIGWGAGNPPRFPAKRAIEAADPDIEKILSDAAERVIDRIENG